MAATKQYQAAGCTRPTINTIIENSDTYQGSVTRSKYIESHLIFILIQTTRETQVRLSRSRDRTKYHRVGLSVITVCGGNIFLAKIPVNLSRGTNEGRNYFWYRQLPDHFSNSSHDNQKYNNVFVSDSIQFYYQEPW